MNTIKLYILLTVLGLIGAACGSSTTNVSVNSGNSGNRANTAAVNSSPSSIATPAHEAAVSSGKELFATNCMICHKEDGTGGKTTIEGKTINAEDLTKDKFKKATDEKLIGYVTNGEPDEGMPAFKGKLKDEEIKAVVAHVRSLQN